MNINKVFCKSCNKELLICKGDIIQMYQENLDILLTKCTVCEYLNEIEIINENIEINIIN